MYSLEYIELGGMSFSTDTDPMFINFLVEANKSKRRVFIRYKEGFEDFSGYHSKDGLTTYCYVGHSTGNIKIPLKLHRYNSHGGSVLATSKKYVIAWGYKL